VVNNGVNGFLLPLGDTDGMAKKACLLLEDTNLYHSFSESAKSTAYNKFSINSALDQYEAMYAQAIR